jgi:energy-coupling factor transporter ATP-binding protein EcfA2
MSTPNQPEGFGKSIAILVAIDKYSNGVPALLTPVADATALADILGRLHGFDVRTVTNEQATRAGVNKVLSDLTAQVGKDDRVLFYFAGHGIAQQSDTGPKGYVLPYDADRRSVDQYIPMTDLNDQLSALACRHMLAVLDCCFAGALRWSSTRHLELAPENLHQQRYAWLVQGSAWQAIASAAYDQKALDVAAGEALGERGQAELHSPFAKALIDGLRGAADVCRADGTGDGVITATELYLYLEDALAPPPGSSLVPQIPILWPLAKHAKGQFLFLAPGHPLNLPPAPILDPEANPWLGLAPYDIRHKDTFFGRRAASERLAARVLGRPASPSQPEIPAERFIVVTGPSGIGKSSLVKAGLLPRLPEDMRVVIVRPGTAPFATLAAALSEVQSQHPQPFDASALRTNPHALAQWTRSQAADGEILLVVDQAEELITMNRDEEIVRVYLEQIADSLNANERLRILFTVRSEFEPQFAQSPLAGRWPSARYLVPQMTQDELRRVIEGPAAVKVMRFESVELIDQLVNEVVQMPGALPLLSFALSEMYASYLRRQGDDRTITRGDYDALQGGVTGSLRVRANHVVDGVDEQHGETARRVLERLVSVEAGAFARRRVRRRELEAADPEENARVVEVLRRLDEARLIITDEVGKEAYLELAHDALILGWDRLLSWVRRDATLIAALRRLTLDAEEWSGS